MSRSPERLAWGWACVAVVFLTACGGPEWAGDLERVPEAELAAFEPVVRNQIVAARSRVERARGAQDRGEAAQAYGELGAILQNYELYEAATIALQNALRLEPESPRWNYYLAVVEQTSGNLASAAERLERTVELAPGYLPAFVRLGEVWIAAQQPAKARAALEKALELDPDCALAHYFLGRAGLAAGDSAAAVTHLARSLELQPEATAVHHLLAQAYREQGEIERAQHHLALRGDALVRISDRMFLELTDYNVGAAARIRRGARAQVAGELDTAIEEYRGAVAADPKNPQARQSLAGVLVTKGRTREAIEEYREARRLGGDDPLVLSNLGALLMATGEVAEAEPLLERAVELDPALENARLALGALLVDSGRPAEALEQYRALLDRDRDNAEGLLGQARALSATGDSRGAVTALEGALRLSVPDRTRARIYGELGSILARRMDSQRALEQLDRAIALDGDLVSARFARANLLGGMGRFRDAAFDYDEVLRRAPASVPARLGGATAWAMAGDHAKTRQCLEDGLDAVADPQLEHALARLLVTSFDEAVRDTGRGLELAERAHQSLSTMESAETLALALAAAGRCSESIELERRIVAQAGRPEASGERILTDRVAARLAYHQKEGSCLSPWGRS